MNTPQLLFPTEGSPPKKQRPYDPRGEYAEEVRSLQNKYPRECFELEKYIRQHITLPPECIPPIRITPIERRECLCFRVNVFKSTPKGIYMHQSFFVEQVSPLERIFTPPLELTDETNKPRKSA